MASQGAGIPAESFEPLRMALSNMKVSPSMIEQKNQEKLRRLDEQMTRIPWKPASIVSLHAFKLYCSSHLLNELRLSPAPIATDDRFPMITLPSGRKLGYTQHVVRSWGKDLMPNEAGEIEASAILPIDLAIAFMTQYHNIPIGGIFCYEGIDLPLNAGSDVMAFTRGDPTGRTRGPSLPMLQAIEYVHEMQVKHYLEKYKEAEEAASGNHAQRTNVITRSNVIPMVKMLRAWGEISADPAWIKSQTRRPTGEPTVCMSCGTTALPNALVCTAGRCTYVFNPFMAFQKLVIDLETPGAGLALRRLAPNQVRQLIKWKRFTEEEAVGAGYRFDGKGAKGGANLTDDDPESGTNENQAQAEAQK